MFDIFYGYWKCPDCKVVGEIQVQTKQLDSLLSRYHIGDEIINNTGQDSFLLREEHFCEHCNMEDVEIEGINITARQCKNKLKLWEVLIEIENNRYKEMVFTGKWKWYRIGRPSR